MGKITLEKKQVTLNDDTFFVFICYAEAIKKAGFTENELDSRLQSPIAHQKEGLKNALIGIVADQCHQKNWGNESCELPMISATLNADTDEFYQLYLQSWVATVAKIPNIKGFVINGVSLFGRLDDDKIIDEKIKNPHILIMYLCLRLFSFSLHEERLENAITDKLYKFLTIFAEELLNYSKDNPLFDKSLSTTCVFDDVGMFLGAEHDIWCHELEAVLKSKTLFNTHLSAFVTAENVLAEIEKIIRKQLIAYLKYNANPKNVNDVLYLTAFNKIEKERVADLVKTFDAKKEGELVSFYNNPVHQQEAVIQYIRRFNEKKRRLLLMIQA